ncbi:DUF1045 domain-containing protein [Streptomyces sp. NBC_01239]|uniref:DUF1045 domain-containing protein n=1 Tax=Streptomyces sp. NBC_01239 TaxID=2903792 RepID=UPI00224DA99A|nr:DUF1045 domain-containing protein [Streptomyces sp. NBC_01239]MCX4813417.1 DUF1045 domain-containing protein [Streptomyces sp. NBC_01239]
MPQNERMRWILFIVFVSLFALIAGATTYVVFFGGGGWSNSDKSLIIKLFIGEIGISVLALFYALFNLKQEQGALAGSNGVSSDSVIDLDPFYVKSYPRSQHPEFFAEAESLIGNASEIMLVGIGINLLWEKHILDLLIRRAQDGSCRVTICMANTSSPHIQSRFIEEEMESNRPQVGSSGVDRIIRALVERLQLAGNPSNFRFVLFENYPTCATLVFGDEIFFYPYGYQAIGNVSPMFHLRNNGEPQARFFIDNARRVIADAVPAQDVIDVRKMRSHLSENWIMAAVYIIPSPNSSFYKFGSSTIGYDVIREESIPPSVSTAGLRQYVGESAAYGFHATLAEALYFTTQNSIERVRSEVKFLSRQFKPFRLNNLRVEVSPHDDTALVVRADDESGTVECLHHELVSRIYGLGVSSTYLAGSTVKALPRESPRAQLMLDRYGSPFIFQDYMLHFTLCGACPPEGGQEEALSVLRQELSNIGETEVMVDRIVLLTKKPGEPRWKVDESFPLCGPHWP